MFRRTSLKAFIVGLLTPLLGAKASAPTVNVLPPETRPITLMVGNSSYAWTDDRGWVFVGKWNRENNWRRFTDARPETYDPDPNGTEMEKRNLAIKQADYEQLARDNASRYKQG